ncbi:hypothetical protein CHS0354_040551 [Potamilus streckersoni]|uniref:Uncharacterized protein n=1 Tax=Potamilus streckersoni TaxID=2493646 RepID=A0AAE0SGU0_9BIVA|nr:hypothetical protein CHS0354_040551 [Potamilus streckersoni]
MECTDLECEHSYPLETEAGRTSSVALLPEVLVIKKIVSVPSRAWLLLCGSCNSGHFLNPTDSHKKNVDEVFLIAANSTSAEQKGAELVMAKPTAGATVNKSNRTQLLSTVMQKAYPSAAFKDLTNRTAYRVNMQHSSYVSSSSISQTGGENLTGPCPLCHKMSTLAKDYTNTTPNVLHADRNALSITHTRPLGILCLKQYHSVMLYCDCNIVSVGSLKLGGDARCPLSPGHTAKHGSYTSMDVQTSKVADI